MAMVLAPTIRVAEPRDLPAIVAIYNEAVAEGNATCDLSAVAVDARVAWLEEHRHPYGVWVAEADGDVVGWVALSAYDDKPCFSRTGSVTTYVSRAARRQGVGSALRRHLVDEARKRGFHALVSRVWATNDASIAMIRGFGWEKVAHLREIVEVDGRFVDCHLFQTVLDESGP